MTEPHNGGPEGGDLVVVDVPDANRYEARVRGAVAGFADYTRTQRLMIFTHSEVDPAYEGRGIGGALVRASLDEARARGLQVVPVCPFFASWISRHPDYQDLVFEARSRVDE